MCKRLIFVFILSFICEFQLIAQSEKDNQGITAEMAMKLGYACFNNSTLNPVIYHTLDYDIIERDREIAKLKAGDVELAKKMIEGVHGVYSRQNSWLTFKSCGFTIDELEITDAIYSRTLAEREQALIKKEQELYDSFVKNGVPESYKPSKMPSLTANATESLCSYIRDSLYGSVINTEKSLKESVDIVVNTDKTVALLSGSSIGYSLFSNLELTVQSPASYQFENINKSIDMPYKSSIEFITTRTPFRTYKGSTADLTFEASVKFNKKTNKWEFRNVVMINGLRSGYSLTATQQDALSDALNRLKEKPHKYVQFKFYDVFLTCKLYSAKGNVELIKQQKLKTLADITYQFSVAQKYNLW